MRPASVNAYFRILRALLNWTNREGLLDDKPLTNVPTPRIPECHIEPFSADQQQQLLDGARRRGSPERDVAVIKLLLDSGIRVSELCGLNIGHLDEEDAKYLNDLRPGHERDDPLFVSEGGNTVDERLTRSGVWHIVAKAARAAGIQGVRASPHTLRHTFAITFLRNGGSVLALQELLGHEDLETVRIYIKLAACDLQQAHRAASPVDRLKLR